MKINKFSTMLLALITLILIPFGVSAEDGANAGQIAGDNVNIHSTCFINDYTWSRIVLWRIKS